MATSRVGGHSSRLSPTRHYACPLRQHHGLDSDYSAADTVWTVSFSAIYPDGLLCAFFYSATSRSLSSIALGELVGFFIYGPLITLGAYLTQASGFTNISVLVSVLLYSFPLGFLVAAVIHVNNMRDVESDLQAGKWTLASIIGLGLSRALYILLTLGAFAIIAA